MDKKTKILLVYNSYLWYNPDRQWKTRIQIAGFGYEFPDKSSTEALYDTFRKILISRKRRV